MHTHARIVIIGGGIVGVSTAYHLQKRGWRDIVVLDQGPLFKNLGSTSHAPGLMFQHNNSRTVCKLAQWSVATYLEAERELNEELLCWKVGSLEIAETPERWLELKRKLGNCKAWGLEADLISREAIGSLVPIIKTDDLYGALHVPSDLDVRGVALASALARLSERDGAATYYPNTPVTDIEVVDGRVRAVHTNNGRIETELVVCAAGLWGPMIGRMVGLTLPMTPMQHLYARTTPLTELEGETVDVRHPIVRQQDHDLYYRQHGVAYGFGSYRHAPLIVPPEQLPRHDHPAEFPSVANDLADSWAVACQRFPALAAAEIATHFNGLFSFTTDGNSIVGESPDVRGFWAAEAVWVTHAGGTGRAVADWLTEGDPGLDLRELDINRFHPHARVRSYLHRRVERQFIEVYDIIHPLQQIESPRALRVSPMQERLVAQGGVFFESNGWERAQWFGANAALGDSPSPMRTGWHARHWSPISGLEHRQVRETAGLFDLTPFAKFEVSGPDALAYLQRLCANDVDKPVGSIVYTAMLTEKGGIRCDLTVTRLGPERFWIVSGGGTRPLDFAWLKRHVNGRVQVQDVSSAYAAVGLWGPQARAIAQSISDDDLGNAAFPYLTAREIALGYVPALALRISYVGELGWELYTPVEYGLQLWDVLWAAGHEHGLIAVGGGAFDSLRIEKGYRLWGSDIHTEYNPYEAGLGFAVRLKKGDFIGREALTRIKAEGPKRRLCCLACDDPAVPALGKEPVFAVGGVDAVGYLTSAAFGHSVGQSLGYAYLPTELAIPGTALEIYSFGDRHPIQVITDPVFDPGKERLRR